MSVVTPARTRARGRVRARGSTHVLLAACLWGTTGTVRTAVEAASNVSIAAVRVVVGGAVLVLSGGGGPGGGGTGGTVGAGPEPLGVALALLSGLAYAVYATVVSALIGRGEDERAVTGALFGASAVLMLPTLLTGAAAWTLGGRGAVVALYLGGVTTAGGYLLLARGLRTTPATTATTLTLAEPAVAAVLGVVVLHETLGGLALGGIALLVASLALLLIAQRRSGAVVDGVTVSAENC